MSLSWKALLGRTAAVSGLASVILAVGVVVGVRVAKADPGGPTRGDLTFAGVLPERAGRADTRLTFVFRRGTSTTAACTVTTGAFEPGPGGAFAVPVPLDGCTDARGLFDGENVFYDVRLGDVSGPVIAPNVAVTPVPYARFADQVSVNNDCPVGYLRSPALGGEQRLCLRGSDEIVRVGSGTSAFWIDRYEASVNTRADASGTWLFTADNTFGDLPRNGQLPLTATSRPAYAVSVGDRRPASWITWFQAAEACRASGKRLPTGEEWLAAANGTVDPGVNNGTAVGNSGCNTRSPSGPRNTGGGGTCRSFWGVQDMIGNIWEWTNEWHAGVGDNTRMTPNSTASDGWPTAGDLYREDATYNIVSSAYSEGSGVRFGLPAAALRGGNWGAGTQAGVFAVDLRTAPSQWSSDIGFRCVVPR